MRFSSLAAKTRMKLYVKGQPACEYSCYAAVSKGLNATRRLMARD
jgi:hypothetical protein